MLVEEGFGSVRELCIAMQTLAGTASVQRWSCVMHALARLPMHRADGGGVLVGMKMDTLRPQSTHRRRDGHVRHYLGVKCCTVDCTSSLFLCYTTATIDVALRASYMHGCLC
jgi:hypothetical protein